MDPPKINFFNDLFKVPVFFDIDIYLGDKYFDVVWGYQHPLGTKMDPQKSIFLTT